MSLLFFCLASLFFLPCCLSSSCSSIPESQVPCNKSIDIKPPFILVHNTTNQCQQTISIRCSHSDKLPKVYIFHLATPWFFLENIIYDLDSYPQNQLIVRDPALEDGLNSSGCGNLQFSFLTPFYEVFDYDQFLSFSTSVKNFCRMPNQSFQSPILGREYTLNYSATTEKNLPVKCYRKTPNASFEWKFSFNNNDGSLVLLSAQYSYSLLSDPECFGQHIVGESKTSRARHKNILIGVAAGLSVLIVVSLLFILVWKHKKLRYLSSSSKLLMQRNTSEQYFHDPKIPELQYTQIFSYEELEEATEQFSESKELGDGGFGTVYKGKLKDGRVVAVKRLYRNSYRRVEQFMNEVEILSQLHHPNLVTLYGCTAPTSHELLLVYEFISQGTVADHLNGPRSGENILIWPIRLSIAVETADALAYLHAVEIIHRDVKTNNILLDDGFHVKVADFGLSRLFPLDVTHVSTVPQGTPGYVDPVYHQCYQLTDKSDVYSFGVVLVELISSKPAVDMSRSSDEINLANLALKKIQKDELVELADPAIGFQSNPEVKQTVSLVAELAFRCLQSDRDMRPSMKEVLEVLRVIQKGNHNSDKLEDIIPSKEEAYLLETAAGCSPKTVMGGWMSQSTTPNTSN